MTMASRAMKKRRVNVGGRLFVGMFSGRVYWAPRVSAEPHGDGTATFHVIGDKRDVTEMFEACARELGWTAPQKDHESTEERVNLSLCDENDDD